MSSHEFAEPSAKDLGQMSECRELFKVAGDALIAGERKLPAQVVGVALVGAGLGILGREFNKASLSAWLKRTILELDRDALLVTTDERTKVN